MVRRVNPAGKRRALAQYNAGAAENCPPGKSSPPAWPIRRVWQDPNHGRRSMAYFSLCSHILKIPAGKFLLEISWLKKRKNPEITARPEDKLKTVHCSFRNDDFRGNQGRTTRAIPPNSCSAKRTFPNNGTTCKLTSLHPCRRCSIPAPANPSVRRIWRRCFRWL